MITGQQVQDIVGSIWNITEMERFDRLRMSTGERAADYGQGDYEDEVILMKYNHSMRRR